MANYYGDFGGDSSNLWGSFADYGKEEEEDLLSPKEAGVNKASQDKREALTFKTMPIGDIKDADTMDKIRVGSVYGDGFAYDAAETKKPGGFDYDDPAVAKKMARQRAGLAKQKGIPEWAVTDFFIEQRANESARRFKEAMMKGYENSSDEVEGPIQPMVDVGVHGKTRRGTRDLAEFRNAYTGESINDLMNNPIDNLDFYSDHNYAGRMKWEDEQKKKEQPDVRDRDLGEITGDTATALAKGVVRTGQTAFGLADVPTRLVEGATRLVDDMLPDWLKTGVKAVDLPQVNELADAALEATGQRGNMSGKFAETIEFMDDNWLSAPTREAKRRASAAQQAYDADAQDRIDVRMEQGDSRLTAEFKDWAGGVAVGGKSMIDNPLALVDSAIESSVQMLQGGIFGKAFASKAITNKTYNMGKKEATEWINSEAGKKAASKVAERAGIATGMAQESMIQAVETHGDIMGKSHEDLMNDSEYYREQIDKGLSPEAAQRQTADNAATLTAATTAAISAVASKSTGAGKKEGNLLRDETTPGVTWKKTGERVGDTVDTAVRETGEEMLQEGGGTLGSNIGTQVFADDEQTLREGVGTSSGAGAVSGTAVGGGLSATKNTVGQTKDALASANEATRETREKVADVVTKPFKERQARKEAEAKENVAQATDTTSSGYDPTEAIDTTLKSNPTTKQERQKAEVDLDTAVGELFDEADTIEQSKGAESKEYKDALLKAEKKAQEVKVWRSKTTRADSETIVNKDATPEQKQEATNNVVERINKTFGSEDFDSTDYSRIITDKDAPKELKELVGNAAVVTNLINDIAENSKKSTDQVREELLGEGTNDRGLAGMGKHIKNIREAMAGKDKSKAQAHLKAAQRLLNSQLAKYKALNDGKEGDWVEWGTVDRNGKPHKMQVSSVTESFLKNTLTPEIKLLQASIKMGRQLAGYNPSLKNNPNITLATATEAETTKDFANATLATADDTPATNPPNMPEDFNTGQDQGGAIEPDVPPATEEPSSLAGATLATADDTPATNPPSMQQEGTKEPLKQTSNDTQVLIPDDADDASQIAHSNINKLSKRIIDAGHELPTNIKNALGKINDENTPTTKKGLAGVTKALQAVVKKNNIPETAESKAFTDTPNKINGNTNIHKQINKGIDALAANDVTVSQGLQDRIDAANKIGASTANLATIANLVQKEVSANRKATSKQPSKKIYSPQVTVPDTGDTESYTAINQLADRIVASGNDVPQNIRDAMARLNSPGKATETGLKNTRDSLTKLANKVAPLDSVPTEGEVTTSGTDETTTVPAPEPTGTTVEEGEVTTTSPDDTATYTHTKKDGSKGRTITAPHITVDKATQTTGAGKLIDNINHAANTIVNAGKKVPVAIERMIDGINDETAPIGTATKALAQLQKHAEKNNISIPALEETVPAPTTTIEAAPTLTLATADDTPAVNPPSMQETTTDTKEEAPLKLATASESDGVPLPVPDTEAKSEKYPNLKKKTTDFVDNQLAKAEALLNTPNTEALKGTFDNLKADVYSALQELNDGNELFTVASVKDALNIATDYARDQAKTAKKPPKDVSEEPLSSPSTDEAVEPGETETTTDTTEDPILVAHANEVHSPEETKAATDALMADKFNPNSQTKDKQNETTTALTSHIKPLNEMFKQAKKVALSAFGNTADLFSQHILSKDSGVRQALFNKYGIDTNDKAEMEALRDVSKFRNEFMNQFKKMLPDILDSVQKGDKTFYNKKLYKENIESMPLHLFRDSEGNMPENVTDAMAMTALNWLTNRAGETLNFDDKSINKLLGQPEEKRVDPNLRDAFFGLGLPRSTIAQPLGQEFLKQMNIKALSDVDGNIEPKMALSAGLFILDTLTSLGYLEQQFIENKDLKPWRGDGESSTDTETSADGKDVVNFLIVKSDFATENGVQLDHLVPSGKAARAIEIGTAGKGVLQKLFNLVPSARTPQDKPSNKVPAKMKRSVNNVAKTIKKYIRRAQNMPFVPKRNMFEVVNRFTDAGQREMLGYQKEEDAHVTEKDSVKGRNLGVVNSWKHVKEFMDGRDPDAPLYFMYSIWKNLRAGIDSSTINPQGDKNHRHLFGAQAWQSKINLGSEDENQMKLALAEALDLVGVDKTPNKKIIELFDSNIMNSDGDIQNPVYQKAVEILQANKDKGLTTKFTKAEERALLDAINATGMKTHGLDGLVALAEYSTAKKSGAKSFTTNLTRETDGITNGVISGMIQMAYDVEEVKQHMNRGGIFFNGQGYRNYSDFIQNPLNNDSYQTLAVGTGNELNGTESADGTSVGGVANELIQPFEPKEPKTRTFARKMINKGKRQKGTQGETHHRSQVIDAIKATMVEFVEKQKARNVHEKDVETVTSAGRNFAKGPLMIAAYGASIRKIKEQKAAEALGEVYAQLVKFVEGTKSTDKDKSAKAQTDLEAYVNNLNIVINANYTVDQIKKNPNAFRMSWQQENQYRTMVQVTYGESVGRAITKQLGGFMDNRNYINHAIRVMAEVFVANYDKRVADKQAKEKRTLSHAEREQIITDLRDEGLLPGGRHYTSEGYQDSIEILKYTDRQVPTEEGGQVSNRYNNGIPVEQRRINAEGKVTIHESAPRVSSNNNIRRKDPNGDPGVTGFLGLNISIDANVNAALMGALDMLNIFDAGIYGINQTTASTNAANEKFREIHSSQDWSIAQTVMEGFQRSLAEYNSWNGNDARAKRVNNALFEDEKTQLRPIAVDEFSNMQDFQSKFKTQVEHMHAIRNQLINEASLWEQFADDGSGQRTENGQVMDQPNEPANMEEAAQQATEETVQNTLDEGIRKFVANHKQKADGTIDNRMSTSDRKYYLANKEAIDAVYKSMGPPNDKPAFFSGEPQAAIDPDSISSPTVEEMGENFENWFGDSQAINPDGTPTKWWFYGKVEGQTEFIDADLGKGSNMNFAHLGFFASQKQETHYGPYGQQLYVRAENPAWFQNGKDFNDNFMDAHGFPFTAAGYRQARALLQKMGHDSAYFEDQGWVVAFDPNQYKSVNNPGTYSRTNNDTFGSTVDAHTNDPSFTADSTEDLTSENVLDTFDKLETVYNQEQSPEHKERLREVVKNLIGPAMDKLQAFKLTLGKTDMTTWGKQQGDQVYVASAKGLLNTLTEMSSQEVFTHEMIHAIVSSAIDNDPNVRRELRKIFRTAEKDLSKMANPYEIFLKRDENGKVQFLHNEQLEREAAKKQYDYIFKSKEGYLHEFATFGLTNENFIKALDGITNRRTYDAEGGVFTRLYNAMGKVLDWLTGVLRVRQNQSTQQALRSLVQDATNINADKRANVAKWARALDTANNAVSGTLSRFIYKPYMKKAEAMANKAVTQRSWMNIPRAAASIPYYIASKEFKKGLDDLAYARGLTKRNMIYKFFMEVAGPNQNTLPWHTLMRHSRRDIDGLREETTASVINQLVAMTDQKNKFSEDEWVAVHDVFLKTDLSSLLENHDFNEIKAFLASKGKRVTRIAALNKKLNAMTIGSNYEKIQAENLGYFMATGKSAIDDARLNAYNIVQLAKQDNVIREGVSEQEMENIIDELATLHALNETAPDAINMVMKRIDSESRREPPEHFGEFMMSLHNQFKEDSLNTLFDGNKAGMIKGWTAEQYDETRSMRVGQLEDEASFKKQGYTRVGLIPKDPADPYKSDKAYLYVATSGELAPFNSGIVSLTNKIMKGTDIQETLEQQGYPAASKEAGRVVTQLRNRNDRKRRAMRKGIPTMDHDNNHLIPVVAPNGTRHNYRYMMSEHTKRHTMGMKNMGHHALGKMVASIDDKVNTRAYGRKMLVLAKHDYDLNYTANRREFTKISVDSKEKHIAEYYKLLPSDVKHDMEQIWGEKEFFVRTELIDQIFGYRKLSLTDFIDSKIPLPAVVKTSSKVAGIIWQEVVKEVKRRTVILTPAVVLGNAMSNMVISIVKGMRPDYAFKMQLKGFRELNRYKDDRKQQLELQRLIRATKDPKRKAAYQRKYDRHQADIDRNPVKPLLDEGVFQNIVEDIDATEVTASRDKLWDRAPQFVQNIRNTTRERAPAFVTAGIRQAYLDPDTDLGDALMRATAYSDFVARYAMYKHRTEVLKSDPQEALNEVIDTFINYDENTSPQIQWLNDMGILMFTKFLFRIQRIIFRMIRDNPASAIGAEAFQRVLDFDASDIMDSNIFGKLHLERLTSPGEIIDDYAEIPILNTIMGFGEI